MTRFVESNINNGLRFVDLGWYAQSHCNLFKSIESVHHTSAASMEDNTGWPLTILQTFFGLVSPEKVFHVWVVMFTYLGLASAWIYYRNHAEEDENVENQRDDINERLCEADEIFRHIEETSGPDLVNRAENLDSVQDEFPIEDFNIENLQEREKQTRDKTKLEEGSDLETKEHYGELESRKFAPALEKSVQDENAGIEEDGSKGADIGVPILLVEGKNISNISQPREDELTRDDEILSDETDSKRPVGSNDADIWSHFEKEIEIGFIPSPDFEEEKDCPSLLDVGENFDENLENEVEIKDENQDDYSTNEAENINEDILEERSFKDESDIVSNGEAMEVPTVEGDPLLDAVPVINPELQNDKGRLTSELENETDYVGENFIWCSKSSMPPEDKITRRDLLGNERMLRPLENMPQNVNGVGFIAELPDEIIMPSKVELVESEVLFSDMPKLGGEIDENKSEPLDKLEDKLIFESLNGNCGVVGKNIVDPEDNISASRNLDVETGSKLDSDSNEIRELFDEKNGTRDEVTESTAIFDAVDSEYVLGNKIKDETTPAQDERNEGNITNNSFSQQSAHISTNSNHLNAQDVKNWIGYRNEIIDDDSEVAESFCEISDGYSETREGFREITEDVLDGGSIITENCSEFPDGYSETCDDRSETFDQRGITANPIFNGVEEKICKQQDEVPKYINEFFDDQSEFTDGYSEVDGGFREITEDLASIITDAYSEIPDGYSETFDERSDISERNFDISDNESNDTYERKSEFKETTQNEDEATNDHLENSEFANSASDILSDGTKTPDEDYEPFVGDCEPIAGNCEPVDGLCKPSFEDCEPVSQDYEDVVEDYEPVAETYRFLQENQEQDAEAFEPCAENDELGVKNYEPVVESYERVVENYEPETYKLSEEDVAPISEVYEPHEKDSEPIVENCEDIVASYVPFSEHNKPVAVDSESDFGETAYDKLADVTSSIDICGITSESDLFVTCCEGENTDRFSDGGTVDFGYDVESFQVTEEAVVNCESDYLDFYSLEKNEISDDDDGDNESCVTAENSKEDETIVSSDRNSSEATFGREDNDTGQEESCSDCAQSDPDDSVVTSEIDFDTFVISEVDAVETSESSDTCDEIQYDILVSSDEEKSYGNVFLRDATNYDSRNDDYSSESDDDELKHNVVLETIEEVGETDCELTSDFEAIVDEGIEASCCEVVPYERADVSNMEAEVVNFDDENIGFDSKCVNFVTINWREVNLAFSSYPKQLDFLPNLQSLFLRPEGFVDVLNNGTLINLCRRDNELREADSLTKRLIAEADLQLAVLNRDSYVAKKNGGISHKGQHSNSTYLIENSDGGEGLIDLAGRFGFLCPDKVNNSQSGIFLPIDVQPQTTSGRLSDVDDVNDSKCEDGIYPVNLIEEKAEIVSNSFVERKPNTAWSESNPFEDYVFYSTLAAVENESTSESISSWTSSDDYLEGNRSRFYESDLSKSDDDGPKFEPDVTPKKWKLKRPSESEIDPDSPSKRNQPLFTSFHEKQEKNFRENFQIPFEKKYEFPDNEFFQNFLALQEDLEGQFDPEIEFDSVASDPSVDIHESGYIKKDFDCVQADVVNGNINTQADQISFDEEEQVDCENTTERNMGQASSCAPIPPKQGTLAMPVSNKSLRGISVKNQGDYAVIQYKNTRFSPVVTVDRIMEITMNVPETRDRNNTLSSRMQNGIVKSNRPKFEEFQEESPNDGRINNSHEIPTEINANVIESFAESLESSPVNPAVEKLVEIPVESVRPMPEDFAKRDEPILDNIGVNTVTEDETSIEDIVENFVEKPLETTEETIFEAEAEKPDELRRESIIFEEKPVNDFAETQVDLEDGVNEIIVAKDEGTVQCKFNTVFLEDEPESDRSFADEGNISASLEERNLVAVEESDGVNIAAEEPYDSSCEEPGEIDDISSVSGHEDNDEAYENNFSCENGETSVTDPAAHGFRDHIEDDSGSQQAARDNGDLINEECKPEYDLSPTDYHDYDKESNDLRERTDFCERYGDIGATEKAEGAAQVNDKNVEVIEIESTQGFVVDTKNNHAFARKQRSKSLSSLPQDLPSMAWFYRNRRGSMCSDDGDINAFDYGRLRKTKSAEIARKKPKIVLSTHFERRPIKETNLDDLIKSLENLGPRGLVDKNAGRLSEIATDGFDQKHENCAEIPALQEDHFKRRKDFDGPISPEIRKASSYTVLVPRSRFDEGKDADSVTNLIKKFEDGRSTTRKIIVETVKANKRVLPLRSAKSLELQKNLKYFDKEYKTNGIKDDNNNKTMKDQAEMIVTRKSIVGPRFSSNDRMQTRWSTTDTMERITNDSTSEKVKRTKDSLGVMNKTEVNNRMELGLSRKTELSKTKETRISDSGQVLTDEEKHDRVNGKFVEEKINEFVEEKFVEEESEFVSEEIPVALREKKINDEKSQARNQISTEEEDIKRSSVYGFTVYLSECNQSGLDTESENEARISLENKKAGNFWMKQSFENGTIVDGKVGSKITDIDHVLKSPVEKGSLDSLDNLVHDLGHQFCTNCGREIEGMPNETVERCSECTSLSSPERQLGELDKESGDKRAPRSRNSFRRDKRLRRWLEERQSSTQSDDKVSLDDMGVEDRSRLLKKLALSKGIDLKSHETDEQPRRYSSRESRNSDFLEQLRYLINFEDDDYDETLRNVGVTAKEYDALELLKEYELSRQLKKGRSPLTSDDEGNDSDAFTDITDTSLSEYNRSRQSLNSLSWSRGSLHKSRSVEAEQEHGDEFGLQSDEIAPVVDVSNVEIMNARFTYNFEDQSEVTDLGDRTHGNDLAVPSFAMQTQSSSNPDILNVASSSEKSDEEKMTAELFSTEDVMGLINQATSAVRNRRGRSHRSNPLRSPSLLPNEETKPRAKSFGGLTATNDEEVFMEREEIRFEPLAHSIKARSVPLDVPDGPKSPYRHTFGPNSPGRHNVYSDSPCSLLKERLNDASYGNLRGKLTKPLTRAHAPPLLLQEPITASREKVLSDSTEYKSLPSPVIKDLKNSPQHTRRATSLRGFSSANRDLAHSERTLHSVPAPSTSPRNFRESPFRKSTGSYDARKKAFRSMPDLVAKSGETENPIKMARNPSGGSSTFSLSRQSPRSSLRGSRRSQIRSPVRSPLRSPRLSEEDYDLADCETVYSDFTGCFSDSSLDIGMPADGYEVEDEDFFLPNRPRDGREGNFSPTFDDFLTHDDDDSSGEFFVPLNTESKRPEGRVISCAFPPCKNKDCVDWSQRTDFTSCVSCFTYYCSKECRKAHWKEHKVTCYYGRVNYYTKALIRRFETNSEINAKLSKLALEGFQQEGRGCVLITFSSPMAAKFFLVSGTNSFTKEPVYAPLKDVTSERIITKHQVLLQQTLQDYNSEYEFVVNLTVFAGTQNELVKSPRSRFKSSALLRCAKIPLNGIFISSEYEPPPETSYEIKVFYLPRSKQHQFVNETEARRYYCREVSYGLRRYGIQMKRDYPDVYDKLCLYVEHNMEFVPITLYGQASGKNYKCVIFPEGFVGSSGILELQGRGMIV